MAKKLTNNSAVPYLYAFDAGNGSCKGVSSERSELIQFAPVIAPITDKRALNAEDEKPGISLRLGDKLSDVLVFGVDDVFEHGKRTAIRRLNARERYTSPDYFSLLDVLYLQVFAAQRGKPDTITPTGILSVPIEQYNDEPVVDEIRATLAGKKVLADYEGCTLRLDIQPRRLVIIPESTGALTHWAYDPRTLTKRKNVNSAGTTLVIDIGYETTDTSLFEGLRFQRDRAFTIGRAGMGVVARAVQEYARRALRDADVSRIDAALTRVAGLKPGVKKTIEPSPGVYLDVTDVYDATVADIAIQIAQTTATNYTEAVSRIVLAGGGAYHMAEPLMSQFEGVAVEVVPDPDAANVYGGYTLLQMQMQRA